jgi:hypothetical protein
MTEWGNPKRVLLKYSRTNRARSYQDTSKEVKSSTTHQDTSKEVKSSTTHQDTSKEVKSSTSYQGTSKEVKSSTTHQDTSKEVKSSTTHQDTSKEVKSSTTQQGMFEVFSNGSQGLLSLTRQGRHVDAAVGTREHVEAHRSASRRIEAR